MATLTIDVPDDLIEPLRANAADAGFTDLGAYVAFLIQCDFDDSHPRTVHSDEELERLVTERLNDRSDEVKCDAADFRRMRERLTAELGPDPREKA